MTFLSNVNLKERRCCESHCAVQHDAIALTRLELHSLLCIKVSSSLFFSFEINIIDYSYTFNFCINMNHNKTMQLIY